MFRRNISRFIETLHKSFVPSVQGKYRAIIIPTDSVSPTHDNQKTYLRLKQSARRIEGTAEIYSDDILKEAVKVEGIISQERTLSLIFYSTDATQRHSGVGFYKLDSDGNIFKGHYACLNHDGDNILSGDETLKKLES
jgi:hypothetical protein